MRLAGGFVGGARAVEDARELRRWQAPRPGRGATCRWPRPAVWPRAAGRRACGSTPSNSTRSSWCAQVVVAVARAELGVFLLAARRARHAPAPRSGPCRSHRRASSVGIGAADVDHGALDAAHDDLRRIEQRAVPVEGDQVEAARDGCQSWLASWSCESAAVAAERAQFGRQLGAAASCARRWPGGRTASRQACRNMRLRPCFCKRLVALEVAVLVVARDRVALRGQVHADLVGAAGLDGHRQQREPARPRTGKSARSTLHQRDGAHARPGRPWRPPARAARRSARRPGQQVLVQRRVEHLACWPARRRPPAPGRSCRSRARGTGPAAPSARCASWRPAGCPRFRGRAGAPVPGSCAAGRAWRSCSITPKLTPLPPCTATPAGLSMASRCSSSSSTGNSRAGRGGRQPVVGASADTRTGGSRSTSPPRPGCRPAARPLFTRTSPLRMIR